MLAPLTEDLGLREWVFAEAELGHLQQILRQRGSGRAMSLLGAGAAIRYH
jgi:hypothetical protein